MNNMMITDRTVDTDGMQLPEWFVPTDKDVICGWARQNHQHPGNERYRKLVEHAAPLYDQATTKLDKTQVIAAVVRKVRADARDVNGGAGGGFVKKDFQTGTWYEIGDDKARDKVGHAIRRVVDETKKHQKKKPKPKSKSSLPNDAAAKAKDQPSSTDHKKNKNKDTTITPHHAYRKTKPTSPLSIDKLNALMGQFSDSPKGDEGSRTKKTSNQRHLNASRKQSGDISHPSIVAGKKSLQASNMSLTSKPKPSTSMVDWSLSPFGGVNSMDGSHSNTSSRFVSDARGMTGSEDHAHRVSKDIFDNVAPIGGNRNNNSDLHFFQNQLAARDASLSAFNQPNSAGNIFQPTNTTPFGHQTLSQGLGGVMSDAFADIGTTTGPTGAMQSSTSQVRQNDQIGMGYSQFGANNTALMNYIQQRQQESTGGTGTSSNLGDISNQTVPNQISTSQSYLDPRGFAGNHGSGRGDFGQSMASSMLDAAHPSQMQQYGAQDLNLEQLRRFSGFNTPSMMSGAALMGGGQNAAGNRYSSIFGGNSGSTYPTGNGGQMGGGQGTTYAADTLRAPLNLNLDSWDDAVKRDHFDPSGGQE